MDSMRLFRCSVDVEDDCWEEEAVVLEFDRYSVATPTWLSSCIILLFLISILSFSLFISASCCTIVLLQASTVVFKNSFSGSVVATFEPLCLIELLGYLLCCVAWLGLFEKEVTHT